MSSVISVFRCVDVAKRTQHTSSTDILGHWRQTVNLFVCCLLASLALACSLGLLSATWPAKLGLLVCLIKPVSVQQESAVTLSVRLRIPINSS